MNVKQKLAVFLAVLTFVVSTVFAPWEVTVSRGSTIQRSYTDAAPLWSAPSVQYGNARLRVEVLVLEWTALAVIGVCAIILLNSSRRSRHLDLSTKPTEGDSTETYFSSGSVGSTVGLEAIHPDGKPEVRHSKRDKDQCNSGVTPFLQWIFLIIVSIGCSAYLSHLRYLGGDSIGETASSALAEAVGGALVLLGIPALVSLLFKKTSRFVVRLVGLCVIVFFNWLGTEGRAKPALDFVSEVNKRRLDWKEDVTEQLESRGGYQADLVDAERAIDAVREKTQNLDGTAKEIGQALLSVNDQVLVLAKRYEVVRKEYMEVGGIDASTIQTREQLDSRVKVIRDFRAANEELLMFYQNIDTHLNAALAIVDITPFQRTRAVQNYRKGANLETLLLIRTLDRQIANDSLEMLSLFRREWGKWRVHENSVLFDRDSAVVEYNSIFGRIRVAGERQVELQRKLVN